MFIIKNLFHVENNICYFLLLLNMFEFVSENIFVAVGKRVFWKRLLFKIYFWKRTDSMYDVVRLRFVCGLIKKNRRS